MDSSRNSGILFDPSGFDGFIKGADDFISIELKVQINRFALRNFDFFGSVSTQVGFFCPSSSWEIEAKPLV